MFEKLFGNVGAKLKMLAKISFCITAFGGMIGGLIFILAGSSFMSGDDALVYGIVLLLVSFLIGWLSSLPLYAFGQFVENTDQINEKMDLLANGASGEQVKKTKKLAELEQWCAAGLITEEEFAAKKAELEG